MKGISLIGFMGAGKTTIGQLLAEKTGLVQVDLDDKITEDIGMTIQAYFQLYGEAAFRARETAILKQYVAHTTILSTGGGIVSRAENRKLLKQMTPVVYLKTTPKTFIARMQQDSGTVRPLILAKTEKEIQEIYESRAAFYEECATIAILTDNRTPEMIVDEILEYIK